MKSRALPLLGPLSAAFPLFAAAQTAPEQVAVYGTLLDSLCGQVAGATLSASQGNGMFEDLRIHGFEASPLQGGTQALAVYQNGVRLNQAFGTLYKAC